MDCRQQSYLVLNISLFREKGKREIVEKRLVTSYALNADELQKCLFPAFFCIPPKFEIKMQFKFCLTWLLRNCWRTK